MQQVMAMTLTKAEFAEALGMRTSDLFVQRMFACMAANSNEEIDGGNDTVVTFQVENHINKYLISVKNIMEELCFDCSSRKDHPL